MSVWESDLLADGVTHPQPHKHPRRRCHRRCHRLDRQQNDSVTHRQPNPEPDHQSYPLADHLAYGEPSNLADDVTDVATDQTASPTTA